MNEAIETLCKIPVPDIGFPIRLTGGAVRDALAGFVSKDLDFAVEAPSFEAMVAAVEAVCGECFKVSPDTFTARAANPVKGGPALDFVLARKDGQYSDGRHPDWVEAASFHDDAMRRDYTMNALGLDLSTGEIFDPTGGIADIENRIVRFVGDPFQRIREDALRVVRGFRFAIVKGFDIHEDTWEALTSFEAAQMMMTLPVERIQPELEKMLQADTLASLRLFAQMPDVTRSAMFRNGLRLAATNKAKPVSE